MRWRKDVVLQSYWWRLQGFLFCTTTISDSWLVGNSPLNVLELCRAQRAQAYTPLPEDLTYERWRLTRTSSRAQLALTICHNSTRRCPASSFPPSPSPTRNNQKFHISDLPASARLFEGLLERFTPTSDALRCQDIAVGRCLANRAFLSRTIRNMAADPSSAADPDKFRHQGTFDFA
ncbi:hypothetical protein C8Q80DRAFT_334412 [Daedaleopsis nitida]|nr:hypothetical protein C8Q80DRAFT_334412 [Daedaleopsis nitida]